MLTASGSGDRGHSRPDGNDVGFVTLRDLFVGEMDANQAEIIGEFYDASVDGASWQPALKRFAQALDADACAMIRRDIVANDGRITHAFGLDTPAQNAYAKRFGRDDVWAGDENRFQAATVFLGIDVMPEGTLVSTPMHREWLAPRGLLHALFVVLHRDGNTVHYLMLLRKAVKTGFTAKELVWVRTLAPRLAAAFRLGSDAARERAERMLAFEALDAMPIGVIIIDRNGAVVHANRFAHAVLAGGEGVVVGDGGVTLDRPGHRTRIRDLIAQIEGARGSTSLIEPVAYSLPRFRQQRSLTCVLVCPAERVGIPELADGPAAILFVGDPERPIAFDAVRISRLYGLSRAEARVAALLARGFRLEEAADSLGIAYETVRKHLKQIFIKTAVARQAELVRMLVTSPAGLALSGSQPAGGDTIR